MRRRIQGTGHRANQLSSPCSTIRVDNFIFLNLKRNKFVSLILDKMSNYEKLNVWHKAMDLTIAIYKLTDDSKFFQKDFSLKDQMRRSSVSIPSNISEGDELGTDNQAIKHFYISKGSAAELYTQLIISNKIGYTDDEEANFLMKECKSISSMLTNLIKSRIKNIKS